jgi:hypothetical protein
MRTLSPASENFPGKLCVAVMSAILLLPAVNLLVDPTEIFGTGLLPHQSEVNDRYLKIDYLLAGCDDCNGFLLGSSRAGYIDPHLLDGLVGWGRFYNMNLSSGNAWDYLQFARYLKRKGFAPEMLVVQLDVTHLYGHRIRFENHPDFSGESSFRFYFENLFSLPYRSLYGKIRNNAVGVDLNLFNWETGVRSKPHAEQRLKIDPDGYVEAQRDFRMRVEHSRIESARFQEGVDETVAALREIQQVADDIGTRVMFFVTPHNQHYLDGYRIQDIEYFLRRLVEVTEYWNFASYSSVTTDDRNYYETSHYRPLVGAMVAARITGRPNEEIPEDFGQWVSRENIEAVVLALRSQSEAREHAGLRIK